MKLLVFALLNPALLLGSSAAFAGGVWSNAKVVNVKVYTSQGFPPGGLAVVTFAVPASDGASCSTNKAMVAIDMSNNGGTSSLALAVRALSLGTAVNAKGIGKCTLDNFLETLAELDTSDRAESLPALQGH